MKKEVDWYFNSCHPNNKEVTWEEFLDYVENVLGIQLLECQKIVMKETFERSKEDNFIIPLW